MSSLWWFFRTNLNRKEENRQDAKMERHDAMNEQRASNELLDATGMTREHPAAIAGYFKKRASLLWRLGVLRWRRGGKDSSLGGARGRVGHHCFAAITCGSFQPMSVRAKGPMMGAVL